MHSVYAPWASPIYLESLARDAFSREFVCVFVHTRPVGCCLWFGVQLLAAFVSCQRCRVQCLRDFRCRCLWCVRQGRSLLWPYYYSIDFVEFVVPVIVRAFGALLPFARLLKRSEICFVLGSAACSSRSSCGTFSFRVVCSDFDSL